MRRNRSRWMLGLVGMPCVLASTAALAATPSTMTEQGRLFDASGAPLTTTATLQFSIYASPSGGAPLWTETDVVILDEGYFSVELGASTPFPASLWDGSTRY